MTSLHPSTGIACIRCGCTDDHACEGGCGWATLVPPVCTACIGDPLDMDGVAETLNLLPDVTWDRFVRCQGERFEELNAYGWLPRDDGRSDFVLVMFEQRPLGLTVRLTTSSAKHSQRLQNQLFGTEDGEDAPHIECERIEQHLPSVLNAARLP